MVEWLEFKLRKNTEELVSSESLRPSTSESKRGRPKHQHQHLNVGDRKNTVDLSERSKPRIIADEDNNSSIDSAKKVLLIARR